MVHVLNNSCCGVGDDLAGQFEMLKAVEGYKFLWLQRCWINVSLHVPKVTQFFLLFQIHFTFVLIVPFTLMFLASLNFREMDYRTHYEDGEWLPCCSRGRCFKPHVSMEAELSTGWGRRGGVHANKAGGFFPLPCFHDQAGMFVCGWTATMRGYCSASSAFMLFHVSRARYFLMGLFMHPKVGGSNFASTKFIRLSYLWYRTAYLGKLCWPVLGNCISFLFFF